VAAAFMATPVLALRGPAERPRKAGGMDEKVSVDLVVSFENGGSSEAVLKLKDGTICRIDRTNRRFNVWSDIIKKKQAAAAPLYVACGAATGQLTTLLLPALRQVVSVAPQADRLNVQFLMSPSVYFVRTTRPGYAEMKQTLEAAAKSQAPVLVTDDVREPEILDVRQPPPGLKMPVI
jgi:hypothetical protein